MTSAAWPPSLPWAVLDGHPLLLAKLVFAIGAPWPFVLGVNAVYAVAAWAAYLAIARTGGRLRRPRSS